MTQDTSAIPLHVDGFWDNPYLELTLGGVDFFYPGDPEGVCLLAGEVTGGGSRSLLVDWFATRRYEYHAVLQCPEAEPFGIVFDAPSP